MKPKDKSVWADGMLNNQKPHLFRTDSLVRLCFLIAALPQSELCKNVWPTFEVTQHVSGKSGLASEVQLCR